jgi:hypothetical protein
MSVAEELRLVNLPVGDVELRDFLKQVHTRKHSASKPDASRGSPKGFFKAGDTLPSRHVRIVPPRPLSGPQDTVSVSFQPSLGGRSLWRVQRR